MKHYITSLILISLVLLGAFFFERQLYLQEQEKIDKLKMSEIEVNVSMTSSILTYIFNNLTTDINLAAVSLGNLNSVPSKSDYKNIFNSIENKEPLFKELSYINKTFIPEYSYPKLSGNDITNKKNFLLKYLKNTIVNDALILPEHKNSSLKNKINSIEKTIAIESPIVDTNHRKNGFIYGDVNIEDLADLIKLDTYFKHKDELEYYLINTEQNSILGTPNRKQKSNVYYKLLESDFTDIETKLFKSKKSKHCIITKLNGKRVYIAGKIINVANKTMTIIGIAPYKAMINLSQGFIEKSSYLLIYAAIIVIIIIVLLINFTQEVKKLKKQVVKLKIEVDRTTVKKEEKQITQSDYFKELQNKVEKMKNN